MRVLKLLILARERVAAGHCKAAHARDERGQPFRFDIPGRPPAVSFSAYGAVGGNDVLLMMYARERLWKTLGARQAGFGNLNQWNDAPERTQAEVVALYDETIAGETRL